MLTHLPISMGGLGIRLMGYQADVAFTASLSTANYILARMPDADTFALSNSSLRRIEPWWREAGCLGPPINLTTMTGGHPFAEEPRERTFQKQLQPIADSLYRLSHALNGLTNADHRQYLQRDALAPAAWLTVQPSNELLVIPNLEFRTLLAARLLHTAGTTDNNMMLQVCPLCQQRPTSLMPSHIYMCRELSLWRKIRHDRTVDVLAAFCPTDSVHTEASITPTSQQRIDLLVQLNSSTLTAIDVTIVATQHKHSDLAHTFAHAHNKKADKYNRFVSAGYFTDLRTFAINPFGSLSNEALAILKTIIPDPYLRSQARTLISVSVARGSAKMMACWSRRTHQLTTRG